MRWPAIWSSSTLDDRKKEKTVGEKAEDALESVGNATNSSTESLKKQISHTPTTNWQIYTQPQTIIATVVLTSACVGFLRFYRSYLRRIPVAGNISSGFFRRRSILGKVTAVGDGDNFRIYHTPGGWLAGWGWLPWRRVPKEKKDLKDKTIHVRLAGVDAPEMAHFGRPSQPYAQEALDWLTSYLSGRRVRAYVYKVDQYSRVVATVYVWKGIFRRDVGLQMLRAGLATVYEAKTGAEFGKGLEKKYRSAEWWAKAKRKGMWAGKRKDFESPREYKTRYGGATPIQETPKK